MKAITASTIAACALTLTACGSTPPTPQPVARPLYDDAHKMNNLELGMDQQKVTWIMGTPSTSMVNPLGFKCLEYKLLQYSKDFTNRSPDSYFVMLYQGKTIEFGKAGYDGCKAELRNSNFDKGSLGRQSGKYARFIGQ